VTVVVGLRAFASKLVSSKSMSKPSVPLLPSCGSARLTEETRPSCNVDTGFRFVLGESEFGGRRGSGLPE